MKRVLVTGGAGYVGSHVVEELHKHGYLPVVLDNLSNGHQELVKHGEFVGGDLFDDGLMKALFSINDFTAVMHFAAFAYVDESMLDPIKYYHNNVGGTLRLLRHMIEAGVKKIIFSSSCATYGVSTDSVIDEDHPVNPINPYGASKLMAERMIADFGAAYGLQSVVFRYFNAAGADPSAEIGEWHDPETHVIPLILESAASKRHFKVFGTDYETQDGTCIRDYVHVCDIAAAHVLGLKYIDAGNKSDFFNLSNGNGFSVLELARAAERVTGREVNITRAPRRAGDPPKLVGNSGKAQRVLGWKPQCVTLDEIVGSAWRWHQRLSTARKEQSEIRSAQ